MNQKNNPKLKKSISTQTLKEVLRDEPEDYEYIAAYCIIAMTGVDIKQRKKAIKNLEDFIGVSKIYVASNIKDNMREISWTYEDAVVWQFVTKISANYRTYKLENRILYNSVN